MSDTVLGWLCDGWLFGRPEGRGESRGPNRRGIARPDSAGERSTAESANGVLDDAVLPRDGALVARVRDGDVEAFTVLFRTYYSNLVNLLGRYAESPSDAEDLAQDTMALLWERREMLDHTKSVRALLFAMGRNVARDARRRQRPATAHADDVAAQYALGEIPTERPADATVLADELDRIAGRQMLLLSPRQREIFQLNRGAGLSPIEIAHILGIAPATVYVQLGRIAKSFYDALDLWAHDR